MDKVHQGSNIYLEYIRCIIPPATKNNKEAPRGHSLWNTSV